MRTRQAPSERASDEIVDHGGNLGRADELYPNAPKPWLDLSTGINAISYPVPPFPASVFERLPEERDVSALAQAAAGAYGAPSAAHVVCAPGTQVLLAMVMGLVRPGQAGVLAPTYAEHSRAADLCGHAVEDVAMLGELAGKDLAIVVNPNNPDGRVQDRPALLDLAGRLAPGGILVVDEAFMDVGPREASLAPDVDAGNVVVLRSFGKFFGLAGLRLGFAVCARPLADRLRARLGPWAVSGPALAVGRIALTDREWQSRMRTGLADRAKRTDAALGAAGIAPAGGTTLYRYAHHSEARALADALSRRGILVRTFAFDATALRFGVPAHQGDFERLTEALREWRSRR